MCSVCLQNPCHPRCPNAPDPEPAAYCRVCGEPLYVGDKHFDGICMDCLEEMTVSDWLELFGENIEEVKEEYYG